MLVGFCSIFFQSWGGGDISHFWREGDIPSTFGERGHLPRFLRKHGRRPWDVPGVPNEHGRGR